MYANIIVDPSGDTLSEGDDATVKPVCGVYGLYPLDELLRPLGILLQSPAVAAEDASPHRARLGFAIPRLIGHNNGTAF
jgi:hypothetical protein